MTPTSKHSAISSRSRTAKAKPFSRINALANNVGDIVEDVSEHIRSMRKN